MLTIQQIKSARSGLDWGQVELGKRSDVSPTTINNIETGKTTPLLKILKRSGGHLNSVVPFSRRMVFVFLNRTLSLLKATTGLNNFLTMWVAL